MLSCGTPCATVRKPWNGYVRDQIQEHGAGSKRQAFGDRGRLEYAQRYGLCAPAEPLVSCKFLISRFAGVRTTLLPKLLSKMGYSGDSVEVGVYKGDHSQLLLKSWGTGGTHTLVDPYVHSSLGCKKKYMDKQCRMNQTKFDQLHNRTRATFARSFPGRARMLRQYSVEASRTFQNSSLSFIYIDARHDYDGVLEDLNAWWPKLCAGGMLAGHDWTQEGRQGYSKLAKKVLPVAAAVHRFLLERDVKHPPQSTLNNERGPMELFITTEHPASWLMFKPAMPCPR